MAEYEPEHKVLVRTTGEDTALVIGERSDMIRIGAPLDTLPNSLLQATALGNAAVQGLVGATEMSGQLVRLTAESSAALRTLGPVTDASGAVLGVVRDGSGQFAKVLRFTPATGLAALESLGPALAAVALQIQLQQISRQLGQIERVVTGIKEFLGDELQAGVDGDLAILQGAFDLLLETGDISDTQWSKIASLTSSVSTRSGQTRLAFKRLIDDLANVRRNGNSERSCHDRLAMLFYFEASHPLRVIDLYVKAQMSVVLFEHLHIHRLVTTHDQHLVAGRQSSERRVAQHLSDMGSLCEQFEAARQDAGDGDLSSWNPLRNLNDMKPQLRLTLLKLKDSTDDVFRGVRDATRAVAGSDRLAIPAQSTR